MSVPQTPPQPETGGHRRRSGSRLPRPRSFLLVGLALLVSGLLAAQIAGVVRTNRAEPGASDTRPAITLPSAAGGPESRPSPSLLPAKTRERPCEKPTIIGTIRVDSLVARATPDPAGDEVAFLSGRNKWGVPQVLDLLSQVRGADGSRWYKALLPIRPNGTKAYVPGRALELASTPYRLVLNRDRYQLALYKGCKRIERFSVGIGTGDTPTPVGRFYLNVLLKPPDPDTIYGVYAYGLSAFSDVLVNWRGGGVVGLHGTNQPWSIGKDSSHGCIRMYNSDISDLAKLLPLGTPITIN
jgi:L,D-transpeptidase catalytic domain